jgi:predicted nucleic acid-binding protein
MNYLLDTCVLSEYLKKQPNTDVIDWVEEQLEESLYLGVLTIGEIRKGISRLPESRRRSQLAEWILSVVKRYDNRILPIDIAVVTTWGDLKAALELKGIILPAVDSLIAATALENDLTVVTRNESDFEPTGVKILNIWK